MPLRLVMLIVLKCALLLSTAASNAADLLARGNGNLAPYGFIESGQSRGLVVDLAEALFKSQGMSVAITLGSWSEQQDLVRAGEGQILLHINPTPAREEWLAFSDAFVQSEIAIFHRNDRYLNSLADLSGLDVAVEAGGYPQEMLKSQASAQIKIMDDLEVGFENLSAGEIDAILIDRWVGEYLLSRLALDNISVSSAGFNQDYSRIAVPLEQKELLAKINLGLDTIRRNGTYNSILNKWSGDRVVFTTLGEQRLASYLKYALILIGLLFLVLAVYAVKLRFARKREQNYSAELEREVTAKTQSLTNTLESQKEMFAVIGHELRTPVATIQMVLDNDSVSAASKLTQIRDISNGLLDVLEDIRVVVAPERALETQKTIDNPASIILRALSPLTNIVHRQGMGLKTNIDESEIKIFKVYSQPLRQVVTNLVKNAAIHSGGTEITVSFRVEDAGAAMAKAILIVEDDGAGVSETVRTFMFEPFRRGTLKQDGSGLGLSIVRQLVMLMGGSVEYGEREGGGASFRLSFPMEFADQAQPMDDSSNRNAKLNLEGIRVLFAEDDATLRLLTEKMLAKSGATVSSFENGRLALEAFFKGDYDLILTDLMMPEMDGYGLTQELRKLGVTNPIIGVTAAVVGEETDHWLAEGASGVISKPITSQKLIDVLEKVGWSTVE